MIRSLLLFVLFFAAGLAAAWAVPPRKLDLLVRGGTVVDGTGAPARIADIGVVGDTIVAVGRLDDCSAARVVEARGLIVAPGFIDLHAHLDDREVGPKGLRSSDLRRRAAQNYVTQGVTTAVVNPDGDQPPSLVEQRRELVSLGIGVNVVLTNGHNTLRALAMGEDQKRRATDAELARMQEILRKGMEEEGSFGLSLGLEYFSGLYSDERELLALAKVLPPYNGVFIPHLRSQGIAPMWYKPSVDKDLRPPTLADSVAEVLRVAENTGCITVFTHMKAWGPGFRGEAPTWIAKLQAARDRGLPVYMDVYPYDSSGSDGDFVALPSWALESGDKNAAPNYGAALKAVLETPSRIGDLGKDIEHQVALKGGPQNVRLLSYPDAAYIGRTLAEIMKDRKLGLVETVIALQLEGDPTLPGGAKMRSFSMAESDIEAFYRQPWCSVSTDGWIVLPEEAVGPYKFIGTNRRCFGSYPRRLAYYSQERKVDTLEEAVRKCSSLPADILNLRDRGRLVAGAKADMTVIDLANLRDNTTFLEPNVYASGLEYVWVNGTAVVSEGRRTLALPGRVLAPVGREVAKKP